MPHQNSSRTAPSRGPWFATAAAALLLTAGCVGSGGGSGGPAISYSSIEPIYNYQEVSYAADGRDLEVVVMGNPFGEASIGDDALGDAVVGAMQGQPGWMVTNFTTTPGETARPLYRVVWLIGVDAGTSLYRLCGPTSGISVAGYNIGAYTPSAAERAAPPKPGNKMFAALCRRERMMSYLGATIGDITSPDDPRFRALIRTATRQLLPHRGPSQQGQNRDLDI